MENRSNLDLSKVFGWYGRMGTVRAQTIRVFSSCKSAQFASGKGWHAPCGIKRATKSTFLL